MKQITMLLFATILCLCAKSQITFSDYIRDGAYVFDDEEKILTSELFTTYKSQFSLNTDDEMVLLEEAFQIVDSTDTLDYGSTHARYQQKHKGYIVEGKTYTVISKCDVVLAVTGSIVTGLDIDDGSLISEADALIDAKDYINAIAYPWEDTALEDSLEVATEDSTATYKPTGELVIAIEHDPSIDDVAENYTLCWKFVVPHAEEVMYIDTVVVDTLIDTVLLYETVYVDATSGTVSHTYNATDYGSYHSGTQWTWHYGYRSGEIETFLCDACFLYKYRLKDQRGIETYTYHTTSALFRKSQQPVRDNNNNWVESDTKTAAQAHWAIERAFDYYGVFYGWPTWSTSIIANAVNDNTIALDGPAAYKLVNYTHLLFVQRDNLNGVTSAAALDVMAHELTHGKIRESSNIGNGYQPGTQQAAMKEGLCDIFGFAIKNWFLGDWNFTIGEQLGNQHKRRFNDPQVDVSPSLSYYSSANWYSGSDAAHRNSGVVRKWFNHLSQGESHWPNPYDGVGIRIASDIAHQLMHWWLWSGSDLMHMRNQSLLIAEKYYGGKCSKIWQDVERAWNDVGIGFLSVCNRKYNPHYPVVIPIGGYNSALAARIRPTNSEGGYTATDYTWSFPAHWTVDLTTDESGFTITNVADDDFSSQIVSVTVDYDEGGSSYQEVVTFPIHFSSTCSGSSKPGKQTINIDEFNETTFNQKQLSNVLVYPNPTHRLVTIDGAEEGTLLQLFNIMGQEVFNYNTNKPTETIDVSNIPAGVFVLMLTDIDGNKDTRKFIKK